MDDTQCSEFECVYVLLLQESLSGQMLQFSWNCRGIDAR